MTNWKDIKTSNATGFYEDEEYFDIKTLVGKTFQVADVTPFENDKGPGAAALILIGDTTGYICTHSIGITKDLTSEEFLEALIDEPVTVTLKEGKSRKSGKYFYYLE